MSNKKTKHNCILHFNTTRFKVAVKRSKISGLQSSCNGGSSSTEEIKRYRPQEKDSEVENLMEEAKTMYAIGTYHENIVNLQGVAYETDFGTGNLSKVMSSNY